MGAPGTTPGPWRVADNGFWIVSGMLSDEKEIARAACGALGYSAERANAHQIAASGALYDALEELRAAGIAFEIAVISVPRRGDEYRDACLRFTQARNRADGALALARGGTPSDTGERA